MTMQPDAPVLEAIEINGKVLHLPLEEVAQRLEAAARRLNAAGLGWRELLICVQEAALAGFGVTFDTDDAGAFIKEVIRRREERTTDHLRQVAAQVEQLRTLTEALGKALGVESAWHGDPRWLSCQMGHRN
jgi:cell division protein ZapA (FtsZ GTPase activity inhibitor)